MSDKTFRLKLTLVPEGLVKDGVQQPAPFPTPLWCRSGIAIRISEGQEPVDIYKDILMALDAMGRHIHQKIHALEYQSRDLPEGGDYPDE